MTVWVVEHHYGESCFVLGVFATAEAGMRECVPNPERDVGPLSWKQDEHGDWKGSGPGQGLFYGSHFYVTKYEVKS